MARGSTNANRGTDIIEVPLPWGCDHTYSLFSLVQTTLRNLTLIQFWIYVVYVGTAILLTSTFFIGLSSGILTEHPTKFEVWVWRLKFASCHNVGAIAWMPQRQCVRVHCKASHQYWNIVLRLQVRWKLWFSKDTCKYLYRSKSQQCFVWK